MRVLNMPGVIAIGEVGWHRSPAAGYGGRKLATVYEEFWLLVFHRSGERFICFVQEFACEAMWSTQAGVRCPESTRNRCAHVRACALVAG